MLSKAVLLVYPGIVVVLMSVFHLGWLGAAGFVLLGAGIGLMIGYLSRGQRPKEGKPE